MNDLTTGYTLGYVDGVERERKRIIKLLEDKRHNIKCDCECDEELIALIKGETE